MLLAIFGIQIRPQPVARDAGDFLNPEDMAGRNLLPLIDSLPTQTQLTSELAAVASRSPSFTHRRA